jgi:hypothetical protein
LLEKKSLILRHRIPGKWLSVIDSNGKLTEIVISFSSMKYRDETGRKDKSSQIFCRKNKANYLTNMSHEIRTLNRIIGFTDLLTK